MCCFEEKIWEEEVRKVRSSVMEEAGPVAVVVKDIFSSFFCFFLFSCGGGSD